MSVSAAALVCAIAGRFLGKKGPAAIARALTGIFLVFTLIEPLTGLPEDLLTKIDLDFQRSAQQAVDQGKEESKKAMAQIIKQETAAYILEKARSLQADIQVSVEVTDDDLPIPVGVRISGTLAPYAKVQLQTYLEQQLGISKENQRWT